MELIIIILIFLILISLFIATEFQKVAEDKGYTGKQYFWMPFLFGIAGYLLVIALPDRNPKNIDNATSTVSNYLPEI